MRETSQPAAHSLRWLSQDLPTSCHPSCHFGHPHIPSPAPPLPACSSTLISWSPGWGNNSLSTWEQLRPRLGALWSEEQLLFAISGSITVSNDNVGGSRASQAPPPHPIHEPSFFSAYSAYNTHVCKTTTHTDNTTKCSRFV